MLTKRTNILFDEMLWRKLVRLASDKNTSVGKLIREAVKEKYILDSELAERRAVLEDIERIRPHLKGKVDYKALINHGRK